MASGAAFPVPDDPDQAAVISKEISAEISRVRYIIDPKSAVLLDLDSIKRPMMRSGLFQEAKVLQVNITID